ncbi:MAG: response regulator, partial [Betaproteobacteria bacterium]|nr:response regulator [Betaproteobacteria bacterium]
MSEQTSVMIVDDEAPARARLRELLGDLAKEFKVEVVGEAAAGTEALVMIESLQPKVVFLDVQMPGMSGIELARHLAAHAAHGRILMPMVVFVTAFDEFAIEAFSSSNPRIRTPGFERPTTADDSLASDPVIH